MEQYEMDATGEKTHSAKITNKDHQQACKMLLNYFKETISLEVFQSHDKTYEACKNMVHKFRLVLDEILSNPSPSKKLPPDDALDAYDLLCRLVLDSTETIFQELRLDLNYAESNYGFINAGFFPDGKGYYYIDNWGMPGIWRCRISTKTPIENRFVLRAIDAVSKSMGDTLNDDNVVFLNIVDELPKGEVFFDIPNKIIYLTTALLEKSRRDQEFYIRGQLGSNKDLLIQKVSKQDRKTVTEVTDPNNSIIVTQIAMIEELRSKDYHHYKCSQKTELLAFRLNQLGYNALYLPIEDNIGFNRFVAEYKEKKQDIVVISLYQIKQGEMHYYNKLVEALKKENPKAFIIVEGASTNMAKQLLAMSPEIDMFVRIESDQILPQLAALKKKDSALSIDDLDILLETVSGGIFIRSNDQVVISRLNKANVSKDITLLPPHRFMSAMWYSERGCPHECIFCRRDTGGLQGLRIVTANERIEWMVERLYMEIENTAKFSKKDIKSVLSSQASSLQILSQAPGIQLKKDTFIGPEKQKKIEILILSENALATKKVIKEFARKIQEFGLNKYFRFKVADTSIATLLNLENNVDVDYIQHLRKIGVEFIGFGTENPSTKFIKYWHKNFTYKNKNGYTLDQIISVNKALIESGFNPIAIRHNLVFSYPEIYRQDAKTSIMLIYLSPQYNSLPEYFGNGWGNNRFSRTFDVPSSILSSIDHRQYAWSYDLSTLKTDGNIDFTHTFYKAKDVPEYTIRRPFRYLKYFDERIPRWLDGFGFPTFYRYAQQNFLQRHCTDQDVIHAIEYWSQDKESQEIFHLSTIMNRYIDKKEIIATPLEKLFLCKSHMVALRLLSFSEFSELLQKKTELPCLLEKFGVSRLLEEGDRLMIPGSFNPECALEKFGKAAITAQTLATIPDGDQSTQILHLIEQVNDYELDHFLEKMGQICLNLNSSNLIHIVEQNKTRREDIKIQGYLRRIAYPDSQSFENLRHVFITEDDEALFNLVVKEMNEAMVPFPEAIKSLICIKMGIKKDEYSLFIKAVKEYTNYSKYYCNGGLIHSLHTKDPNTLNTTIKQLENELEKEDNKLIISNIRIILKEVKEKLSR